MAEKRWQTYYGTGSRDFGHQYKNNAGYNRKQ